MDEATDLERKAEKVVQALTAKGPELTLAVHTRLTIEINKIVGPWQIHIGTSQGEYYFFRYAHDGVSVAARVKMKLRKASRWGYETPGASLNASPNSHDVQDDPHEAMDAADEHLRLSGKELMAGRPTAGPWKKDEEGWVRIRAEGPSKSHLVRVFQPGAPGSNWHWKLTKLSGPGPTKEYGPWATKDKAMVEADGVLEQVGWVLQGPFLKKHRKGETEQKITGEKACLDRR